MSNEPDWSAFYERMAGREPRPLFTQALALFDDPGQAIDLGCGDGVETFMLIESGWRVLATDFQPEAIRLVESKITPEHRFRLETQVASFEDVQWLPADLIYAGLSLPFCPPAAFENVWENIVGSINPGGLCAGHFFGNRDTWAELPEVICLPRPEIEALFADFEIEHISEIEENKPASSGGVRNSHKLKIIARKRG